MSQNSHVVNQKNKLEYFLKESFRIRVFEEMLIEQYSKGNIRGTLHTSIGQETIPLAIYQYLLKRDWIFSNHRGHGHFLARTNDYLGLACEILGKKTGVSYGVGGSQHLYAENYISNGIQGGMTPIAVGAALKNSASKDRNIAICHIGDGTLGEGLVYEALNIAGLLKSPILFVLEDNEIAQSTLTKNTISGSIRGRFEAFGWEYYYAESNNWMELDANAEMAVKSARDCRPTVLHVKTNRLYSHSKGDDNRDLAKIQEIRVMDPLNCLLKKGALNEEFISSVRNELENVFHVALSQEDCDDIEKWLPILRKPVSFRTQNHENIKVIDAIRNALKAKLESDQEFQIIGEDIQSKSDGAPIGYGGAFKVTGNLSDLFPGRVKNAPISEAGIVGVGIGLALSGSSTCVEIMFGDFMTLIVDQMLQHASKFTNMFGREIAIPLLIRTPMGGRRGYGPTHSQSLERLFLGIQNVNLIAPNHRVDVYSLYKNALVEKNPTISFEHKLGYNLNSRENLLNGYEIKESIEVYPTVIISKGSIKHSITILAYGYNLYLAEQALIELENYGVTAEIVSPSCICPLNVEPIIKSMIKTGRFLSIEEGSGAFGLGSAVVAYAINQGVYLKDIAMLGNDGIIPASYKAEEKCLPGVASIVKTVVDMLNEESYE